MKKFKIIFVLIIACTTVFGQTNHRPVTLNPNSGYININELHYGYGLGGTTRSYSKQFYGLTTMHGYKLNIYGLHINHSLLGGIGTGILFYNGGPLFPLYLDLRFGWNSKKISPIMPFYAYRILDDEDIYSY